jgi:hypothetical protein
MFNVQPSLPPSVTQQSTRTNRRFVVVALPAQPMSAVHGQQQRTSSSSSSHRHHHRRLHTGISIGTHDFAHDALSLAHYHHHQDASEVMSHKPSGKSIRGGGGGDGKEGLVSPPTSKQDVESTKSNLSTSDDNNNKTNMEVIPRIDSTENLQGADIEAGNSDSEESLAYSLGNNNNNNHHQNNTNHHQNSEGSSCSPHQSNNSNTQRNNEVGRRKRQTKRGKRASTIETFKEDWEVWSEFFRPRRKHILAYIKYTLFYFLLPAFGISAILFYLRGNPTKNKEAGGPSSSYILLFCCRRMGERKFYWTLNVLQIFLQ